MESKQQEIIENRRIAKHFILASCIIGFLAVPVLLSISFTLWRWALLAWTQLTG